MLLGAGRWSFFLSLSLSRIVPVEEGTEGFFHKCMAFAQGEFESLL